MDKELLLANFLKAFFLITSPITLLVGIFLLFDVDTYMRIENFLARSYGLPKKSLMSQLTKKRESLQMFLLKRRRFIGIICLFNSLAAFFFATSILARR